MRLIIHNIYTFIIALIGLIGGLLWCLQSNWDFEPLILLVLSAVEIIFYFIIPKNYKEQDTFSEPTLNFNSPVTNGDANNTMLGNNNSSNTQNNKIDISFTNNFSSNESNKDNYNLKQEKINDIDFKKNKISILFIDDDKNFNIVRILKDSGWKNTKTITDVKSLDDQNIKNAEIIFVDINGVGKILNLPHEGLDLALMIKQKYNKKKVIIYSANSNNNIFHEAWDVADSRLAKNALPYQFQHLVEMYSLEYYNN